MNNYNNNIKGIVLITVLCVFSFKLMAQTKTANPKKINQIIKWTSDGKTKKIVFPPGTYKFSKPLSLENDDMIFEGTGKENTILKLVSKKSSLIEAKGNSAFFKNLTFDGGDNQKGYGNTIFKFHKSKGHSFENVEFTNSKWNAISAFSAYATDGLVLRNCVFSNIDFHPIKIFNRNTNLRKGKVIASVDKIIIDGCIFKEGYETAISSDNGNDREESGDGTGRRYTESTSLNGTIIQNCIFEKSKQFHIAMVQTSDVIFRNNVFMGMTDDAGGGCQPMHFEQFTQNIEIYDNTFHMPNTVSQNYIYIRISGTEGHKRVTQQRPSETYKTWTYKVHGSNERRASVQCARTGNINKECKRDVHAYGPRNIYIAGNTFKASEKINNYIFIGEGENIQIGLKKDGSTSLNKFLGGNSKTKKITFGGHDEGTGNVNILGNQNIVKSNIEIKKVSFDLPPIRLKKPIVLNGSSIEVLQKGAKKHGKTKLTSSSDVVSVDVIAPEHGMADPHAWVENDTVYVICGHDESWEGKGSFRMDRWEVWSTTDLKNWKHHRNIYPKDTYIGDHPNCWAGDITERDGKYYWFFSNRNINTGVMVADKITGEYKDLLGKPLLPKKIIPGPPYDPEIFIENDVYTICFGAGTYYMATLSKDMKSLTTEPKKIIIYDEKGNSIKAEDKPTLFKRNGWYYLVYGSRYSMAKDLYGPYTFKGAFLNGGHTSFFEWKNQMYVLQENHDISAFYRGASLKPVFFNEDNSIIVPPNDRMYPSPGRPWEFKNSTMGWKALNGTSLKFKNGKLVGKITEKDATIQSAPWLYTNTKECSKFTFSIKNTSNAKQMKLALHTRNPERGFWKITTPVDWEQQQWLSIPISSNDTEVKTYTLDLSKFSDVKERLMQIALKPAFDSDNGTWEIDEIQFK